MCTAVSLNAGAHYFGRNLDLQYCYKEQVAVTPRHYPFHFRSGCELRHHYAMIGMATVSNGYPLYYEATNERGLSIAGLSFSGSAMYHPKASGKDNLPPFELIPWILGQCASTQEAERLLRRMNVWNLPFSREFPLSPLHWLLADKSRSIVIEPTSDGLKVYDNPVGVLTNEPPFPYHLHHLADYGNLSPVQPEAHFCGTHIQPYSNGMGAIGLPGDYSSASRFVRASYVKCNSPATDNTVSQFFHILNAVSMPLGSVQTKDGKCELTRYCCCCDTAQGIYYYSTYENRRLRAVQLHKCDLCSEAVITFDLHRHQDIFFQN